jgi:DNA topoisomerase-1
MFKLPRKLGTFEDKEVISKYRAFRTVCSSWLSMYASLPKDKSPMTITFEESIEVIKAKQEAEVKRHIKSFDEEPDLAILNGRFGPYIAYKGSNYKIPKSVVPQDLDLAGCMKIIQEQQDKKSTSPKRGKAVSKKSK